MRGGMSSSKSLGWTAAATLVGCAGGAAWGWLGSGGYEANDSIIGTAFLCGLLSALLTAVFLAIMQRRQDPRR